MHGKAVMMKTKLTKKKVQDFAFFGIKLLKQGGYVILLADVPMMDEWILAFVKFGFFVMSNPFTFMYQTDFVPKMYVSGFAKNGA